MAVKMHFTLVNGTDSFDIEMIEITNLTSDSITLLENSTLNANLVPNKPSFEELETNITRDYIWDKNPNIRFNIVFRRGKSESGFNICDMNGVMYSGSAFTGIYFGQQYPTSQVWYNNGIINSTYTGQQIIGYNRTTKLIYSLRPLYATYVNNYYRPGQDYYTLRTALVQALPLTKGTYTNSTLGYIGNTIITDIDQKVNESFGVTISNKITIYDNNIFYNKLWDDIFNYTTLPSYPNQNPDRDDDNSGQSPSDPPIPGDGDTTSDAIPNPPSLPLFDVTNTGFVVIYNPTVQEIRQLAYFMWSGEFVDLIKKMFTSPFDALISLKMLFCPITSGASQTVWLGNVETDVTMAKVTSQFTDIDMGTVNVNEFFGSFADYSPFTKIQIYLPFIGFKDLNVDEVMNSQLHLRYRVDVYTGACIAYLTVTKTIKSTNLNSILYQFDGNCAMEIPFTSNDNSRYVAAIMNSVASSALSLANTSGFTLPTPAKGFNQKAEQGTFELGSLAPVANGMLDIMSAKPNVQRAGSLSGAVSAMAVKQPYLIIHRPIAQMPANYQHYIGIPLNLTRTLSNVKGFTVVSQVFLTSDIATDEEIVMITEMLKNGVIF